MLRTGKERRYCVLQTNRSLLPHVIWRVPPELLIAMLHPIVLIVVSLQDNTLQSETSCKDWV